MSEGKFKSALGALSKSEDNNTLLKILSTIRKEVEWPKNKDNITKLREKEYLQKLVGSLQSQKKNVVDVSLSILGNCFMDRDFARDLVGTHNIFSPLNQLLKRFPKEDSINGRIFRIIGNICQHRDQLGNIILDRKPQIVTHIVDFINKMSKDEVSEEKGFSEATVLMAIRALKLILNYQTVINLVKTFGVLKAVGSLFIKYSLEWQESQKNENLLQNIIKLFQDYSRYKYYHSIMEMRNTDRGDSLIHLSSVMVVAPKRVVKIVMNFIRISQLKSELPIPEMFDKFIEVLNKYSIIKEFDGELLDYLQCLCFLLDHPSNRNSERCGKSIPHLIQLLQEFQEQSNRELECCILLISCLIKCRYDDNLMMEQIRCNIIPILVKKLQRFVGSENTFVVEHSHVRKRGYHHCDIKSISPYRKKQYCADDSFDGQQTFQLPRAKRKHSPSSSSSVSDEEVDFIFGRSPSPCSSSDSDMPASWSSPSSSPKSFIKDVSDSDSDNYSPICSEADNSEFPIPLPEEEEEETRPGSVTSEVAEMEVEESTDLSKNSISDQLRTKMIAETLKLFRLYAKLHTWVPQLASEELLVVLLKCSGFGGDRTSDSVDMVQLICTILDYHECLIPLMQTEFIQTIYSLSDILMCKLCNTCSSYCVMGRTILQKFTTLAESGVGKGEIAHKLMRGDDAIKQKLVLVIPYIVENKHILGKLMMNCGGLNILMKLLREDTELKSRSIKVLCVLAAKKLEIANPKDVQNAPTGPKIAADQYELDEECTNIVTFKLDDGTLLKADRDFLSEKSDFFNRLLNGSFKESAEDEIALHKVDSKPFRCLLHLLKNVNKTVTVEVDVDVDTLLDVISLSDRFLMVDLCVSLTNCVEHFKISMETVPIIYRWSLESGTNLLRVESIAFALVENISDDKRFAMFEKLFGLGYSDQLVDDIQKLLIRWMAETGGYNRHKNRMMAHLRSLRDNLLKECL